MDPTAVHRLLGSAIIAAWLVVAVWALALRLLHRQEAPAFWRAVSFAQILLVVQLVAGAVLFLVGRRPGSGDAFTNVFHTLYGFGFPVVVLFVSHKWAREGRYGPFALFSIAGLVIFALAVRARMVGFEGA
jgi:hypothetical protein